MPFAILQENSDECLSPCWVSKDIDNGLMTMIASVGPSQGLVYGDKSAAERDAATFRAENAKAAAQLPLVEATFTVVVITENTDAECRAWAAEEVQPWQIGAQTRR
jgi:hypothetical protein